MMDLLLAVPGAKPDESGDVVLLYDPSTNKDISGKNATSVLSGAITIDNDFLIGEASTLHFTADTAKQVITFATPQDLSATNWTLEWSTYNTVNLNNYAHEISINSSTPGRGLFGRYGDVGFIFRLHFGNLGAVPTETYAPPITSSMTYNTVSRFALVSIDGKIFIYRNGVRQTIAKGSSDQNYTLQSFSVLPLTNITSIQFGDLNGSNIRAIPGYHGMVRLSNYARYKGNYTPVPFGRPTV